MNSPIQCGQSLAQRVLREEIQEVPMVAGQSAARTRLLALQSRHDKPA